MLVGTDPGYAPRLERARRLMDEEWSGRHPGETIGQRADRVMNRVTVAYVDRSPQLDDTLAAFEKAGFTVRLDRQEMDREEFRNRHGGETFHVDPEFGEGWDGQRNDRIAECVMMQAVVSVDEAGDRIAFLRDAGLPESSGSDDRSEGDEPSSLFEGSMNENENAAPIPVKPWRATDAAGKRSDGNPAGKGRTRSETGGDLSASETGLVDLYEPEEWDGPDLFGEYSPEQEVSVTPTMPVVPAMELSMSDIQSVRRAGRTDVG